MAAGAALGEGDLAAGEDGFVGGEVCGSAGGVLEEMRFGALEEEERHVDGLGFGGLEVAGVGAGDCDRDRGDFLAADEGVEVEQPLFAEGADVEVDAVEGAECAYGVGAVLEDAWGLDDIGRGKELCEGAG